MSRQRGRCELCNCPVSTLRGAATAPTEDGVVIGEGEADPDARTVADVSLADLRRAATVALDDPDAQAPAVVSGL
ncbi:MAG: hypothetical protein EP329_06890, partial [Deltaproteobacteria bacterium]